MRVTSFLDLSRMRAQYAFLVSKARVRGYGGAMGGGKTRALCEAAFQVMLDHPGIVCIMARAEHASIVQTTKRVMMEEVLPRALVARSKASQGEDYVQLPNSSQLHFIGLDRPQRWFSAEIGDLYFDEAHEIEEEKVLLLATRLRQRCLACREQRRKACPHLPHRLSLTFNPDNPSHWLYRWFVAGAKEERWPDGKLRGYRKDSLLVYEGKHSLGDAEFLFCSARENPYLPPDYVERTLAALPELLRERYLEGKWVYVSGRGFFDQEALDYYETQVRPPLVTCRLEEDDKGRARARPRRDGPWHVYQLPVRAHEDPRTGERIEDRSYIVSVDCASGTYNDYSACIVLDRASLEVVADLQAQLEPSRMAREAALIARIYNKALIVPEITGGWGFSVVQELRRLGYPRLYTRPVLDRLGQAFTDQLGWDTNTKTRALMLDTLDRLLRERALILPSARILAELRSFVWPETRLGFSRAPRAQKGANDDLVMALAIACAVAFERRPRSTFTPITSYVPSYEHLTSVLT